MKFAVSDEPASLLVLGLNIAFRPGADMERARRVAQFVTERYDAQKLKSPETQGKDLLLTFLVLDLADELLQMKTRQESVQIFLENLLEKIEKSL